MVTPTAMPAAALAERLDELADAADTEAEAEDADVEFDDEVELILAWYAWSSSVAFLVPHFSFTWHCA